MRDDIAEVRPMGGWGDHAHVDWFRKRIGKLEARRAGSRCSSMSCLLNSGDLWTLVP